VTQSVTVSEACAAGATRLIVFCLGKRPGDWPCCHSGALPADRFRANKKHEMLYRR
jgi:hypothetical protein